MGKVNTDRTFIYVVGILVSITVIFMVLVYFFKVV